MADRILADPSRRRVFEKENLYNLLELPKRQECNKLNTKPSSQEAGAQKGTDTHDSDEDELVLKRKNDKSLKVALKTQKQIKKDKKYCEYQSK